MNKQSQPTIMLSIIRLTYNINVIKMMFFVLGKLFSSFLITTSYIGMQFGICLTWPHLCRIMLLGGRMLSFPMNCGGLNEFCEVG